MPGLFRPTSLLPVIAGAQGGVTTATLNTTWKGALFLKESPVGVVPITTQISIRAYIHPSIATPITLVLRFIGDLFTKSSPTASGVLSSRISAVNNTKIRFVGNTTLLSSFRGSNTVTTRIIGIFPISFRLKGLGFTKSSINGAAALRENITSNTYIRSNILSVASMLETLKGASYIKESATVIASLTLLTARFTGLSKITSVLSGVTSLAFINARFTGLGKMTSMLSGTVTLIFINTNFFGLSKIRSAIVGNVFVSTKFRGAMQTITTVKGFVNLRSRVVSIFTERSSPTTTVSLVMGIGGKNQNKNREPTGILALAVRLMSSLQAQTQLTAFSNFVVMFGSISGRLYGVARLTTSVLSTTFNILRGRSERQSLTGPANTFTLTGPEVEPDQDN